MTSSHAWQATADLFARWNNQGVPFSPTTYLAALCPLDRHGRLEHLLDLCNRHGVVDNGCLGETAMAMLCRNPRWQERVTRFLLLPVLLKQLTGARPAGLTATAADWQHAPLNLCLTQRHVGLLAAQCLAAGYRLDDSRVSAILELLDGIAESPSVAKRPLPDTPQRTLALILLGTEEMPSAMLATVAPKIREGDACGTLRMLHHVLFILQRLGFDQQAIGSCIPCLLGLMMTVDKSKPLKDTLLFRLLDHLPRLAKRWGVTLFSSAAEWYRNAEECIELFPGQVEALREVLAQDVILSWTGHHPGSVVVERLLATWLITGTPEYAATERLVSLVGSARQEFGGKADIKTIDIVARLLDQTFSREEFHPTMATYYLHACRMVKDRLPANCRSAILSLLFHRVVPLETHRSLLEQWSRSPVALDRTAARVASTLGDACDLQMCRLLWEVILSPACRWPFVACHVSRLLAQPCGDTAQPRYRPSLIRLLSRLHHRISKASFASGESA